MIHLEEIALSVIRTLSVQSIYAAILFPVIWILVRCTGKKNPHWQHWLWLLVLLRLIIPPDMSFTWSAANLIQSHSAQIFYELSEPAEKMLSHDASHGVRPESPFTHHPVSARHPKGAHTIRGGSHLRFFSLFSLRTLCLMAFCMWFAVVALMMVRRVKKRCEFQKTALKGEILVRPDIQNHLKTWRKRLRITRKIVVKSDPLNGPAYTIGIFRPVVVLPEYLVT